MENATLNLNVGALIGIILNRSTVTNIDISLSGASPVQKMYRVELCTGDATIRAAVASTLHEALLDLVLSMGLVVTYTGLSPRFDVEGEELDNFDSEGTCPKSKPAEID